LPPNRRDAVKDKKNTQLNRFSKDTEKRGQEETVSNRGGKGTGKPKEERGEGQNALQKS